MKTEPMIRKENLNTRSISPLQPNLAQQPKSNLAVVYL
jgi:hypothetical protein